ILNGVVDIYLSQNQIQLSSAAGDAALWLNEQLVELKKKLESSEQALYDYKRGNSILSVSLDDQSNMFRAEIQQLTVSLTQAKARRQQILSRYRLLDQVKAGPSGSLPAKELLESAVLQQLRVELLAVTKELESLKGEGKGENHPQVSAAQGRKDATGEALKREVKNVQAAMKKELVAVNAEIGGLEELAQNAHERALNVNELEIEFKRLARTRDTNERLLSLVTERAKESDLERMLRVNNLRVIDRPVLPTRPVSPRLSLNLAAGAMGGLLLGFLFAFGREQLDRTLSSPDDIHTILHEPFLGLLPRHHQEKKEKGRNLRRGQKQTGDSEVEDALELVVHASSKSQLAEAARRIRTNIVFSSPDRPPRSLLITSASAGDGKTTVATWVATTIAQSGESVVLIDCDMRRPRLHRVFQLPNQLGVSSLLVSPEKMNDALVKSPVKNLTLLPSGPLPPNPSELFHSVAFQELLVTLTERFDRVIIDSPPLAPVTDSAVIAAHVDGVLMVTWAKKTQKELARRALASLHDVGANILGVVLNAVDLRDARYGQRYDYYSYYGSTYGESESQDPPTKTL
ncbi:MAG: polysaccharide biosynthesis tyrosine autokinase, partial [Polyangiaceae bacterium]|nr:polysaccharide biosynthesis tyrosine autokinase [Polyangiaceae bacterium]